MHITRNAIDVRVYYNRLPANRADLFQNYFFSECSELGAATLW